MKHFLWLYILNTALFMFPIAKQFRIIVRSPENDPYITSKVLFFICSLALLMSMWACYFKLPQAAWFFFMVVIVISIWTYNYKPKIKKK